VPEGEARKKVPSVDGANTRKDGTRELAPVRRRSAWSIWLAPAKIAVTTVTTLRPRTRTADASAEVDLLVHLGFKPEAHHEGRQHDLPGIGHQGRLVEGHRNSVDPRDTGFTESASSGAGNCDF